MCEDVSAGIWTRDLLEAIEVLISSPGRCVVLVSPLLILDELAVVEAEANEVGAADRDEGEGPVIQLVDVNEAEALEPIPDALQQL